MICFLFFIYKFYLFFFGDFFELVGTDAAEGAFVIGGQLFAFVNITANGADKLFHTVFLQLILFLAVAANTPEGKLAAVYPPAGSPGSGCVEFFGDL